MFSTIGSDDDLPALLASTEAGGMARRARLSGGWKHAIELKFVCRSTLGISIGGWNISDSNVNPPEFG